MNFLGYTIDTLLEWVLLAVFIGLILAVYFSIVWFIQKFATGIVGGLILMLTGLGLILIPTYTLIAEDLPTAHMLLYGAAICAGCITTLIGTFSLRDFQDF